MHYIYDESEEGKSSHFNRLYPGVTEHLIHDDRPCSILYDHAHSWRVVARLDGDLGLELAEEAAVETSTGLHHFTLLTGVAGYGLEGLAGLDVCWSAGGVVGERGRGGGIGEGG